MISQMVVQFQFLYRGIPACLMQHSRNVIIGKFPVRVMAFIGLTSMKIWVRKVCFGERLHLFSRINMHDNERKPPECMLQSGEVAALITLSESSVIVLEDEAFDAFVAALDAPVKANARLKELFVRPPLWEQ